MAEDTPRIRRAPIPDDSLIIVRGEVSPVSARRLAGQFRQRFSDWGRWGLSAFHAGSDLEVDHLACDRLQGYEVLSVYPISALLEAGFDVVPTFRRPHVTITWADDLDTGLDRLDSAEHVRRENPYHEISE